MSGGNLGNLKLWQLARVAWAKPTSNLHALRRAWGRAVYNRRRQRIALARRHELIRLLERYGYFCGHPLQGVGGRWLYERYVELTGVSRRTFYEDLAAVRQLYEQHYPDGPERGVCACTPVGRSAAPQSGAPRGSQRAWHWRTHYLALRLAVHELPQDLEEAVLAYARRRLAAFRTPRRWQARASTTTTTTTTTCIADDTGATGAFTPGANTAPGAFPVPRPPVPQPQPQRQRQPQVDWWEAWARAGAALGLGDDPWS